VCSCLSNIQAVEDILQDPRRNWVVAAPTGSGKTAIFVTVSQYVNVDKWRDRSIVTIVTIDRSCCQDCHLDIPAVNCQLSTAAVVRSAITVVNQHNSNQHNNCCVPTAVLVAEYARLTFTSSDTVMHRG